MKSFLSVNLIAAIFLVSAAGFCQSAPAEISPTHITNFEYPTLARSAMIQGTVELAATISPEGEVAKVKVISGHPLLVPAAKAVLSKWRFTKCATQDCEIRLTFIFVLNGLCDASQRCPTEFEMDLPNQIKISAKAFRGIAD